MTRAQWGLLGVAVASVGAVVVLGVVEHVRSAVSEVTQTYKGFTITCTCGALGPGCAGGWKVRDTTVNQIFSEAVQATSGLTCLEAARARIDTYGPDTVPA